MSNAPKRQPSKRPRRSAQETREVLIEHGLAALRDHGLSIGLDAVTLERAHVESDLPRSSAYAAWPSTVGRTPQQEYQREVLRRAIRERLSDVQSTASTGEAVLDALVPGATPVENLRAVVRVACEANFAIGVESQVWRLVMALQALVGSQTESNHDAELAEWLSATEVELRATSIESIYRPLSELAGFEPRPEYGERAWDLVAIGAGALAEGLVARNRLSGASKHLTEVDRNGESWTLLGLGVEALLRQFFTID